MSQLAPRTYLHLANRFISHCSVTRFASPCIALFHVPARPPDLPSLGESLHLALLCYTFCFTLHCFVSCPSSPPGPTFTWRIASSRIALLHVLLHLALLCFMSELAPRAYLHLANRFISHCSVTRFAS